MSHATTEVMSTPRRGDLGLAEIANKSGLRLSRLPNGAIFAIERVDGDRSIMINQVLGSPVTGGMGRLYLRTGGVAAENFALIAPEAVVMIGGAEDRFVWTSEVSGLEARVELWLHPTLSIWFWRVAIVNRRAAETAVDLILLQDLGLGSPGFLMNNEAYASQYLDHFPAQSDRLGHVIMTRQNLSQGGAHPWVAHGCLEGAQGFATDFRDVLGPADRDADGLHMPFASRLASRRLQYETACAALQSPACILAPGATKVFNFFGLYLPDHPGAHVRCRPG